MIQLHVFGEPQPQGNKTGFVNKKTGKVVMREGRRGPAAENFKDWRGAVAAAARDWQEQHGGVAPLDEPVLVETVFWLTKGSSLPKWRWLPWSRPDADKLVRAVLDGISKILIRDDGRVTDLVVRKRFALDRPPGCEIRIHALGSCERAGVDNAPPFLDALPSLQAVMAG